MAISFYAAGGVATGANPVVSIPANSILKTGDLLVLMVASNSTITVPAGWTLIVARTIPSEQRISLYYRFAVAPEAATVSVTCSSTASKAVVAVYTGVNAVDTIAATNGVTGTTVATNTLVTTYANEFVISAYAMQSGAANWTAPASTTTRVNSSSTSTINGILLVDEFQAAAGTSSARTATSSVSKLLTAASFSIISNDRYWVGGTDTWNDTAGTKWALGSGAAGGQAAPTTYNDVYFDSASGAGTVTIDSGSYSVNAVNCTGFTGTLTGTSGSLTVRKDYTLAAGMTYSYTGTLFLAEDVSSSATGIATVTTAGKTLGPVIAGSAFSTLRLGDALTVGAGSYFELNEFELDLNNFTLSTGRFVSNSANTRFITFGTGNIILTSTTAGQTVLSMATVTNFTSTGTGGFVRNQAATATLAFGSTAGGTAANAPNLTVNGGASALTITATSHFKTINFTGSTSTVTGTVTLYGSLTLASGGTYTALASSFAATATLSSAGRTLGATTVNGAGITVTLGDALTLGTTNTFTLTNGALDLNGFILSTGAFSSSNSNTRSIAFGSGYIALTSTTAATTVLSMGGASNFTYTGTGNFTRVQAATATITFGTSGAAAANVPNLTVTSGASSLTITATSSFKTVDFTGSTSSVSGAAIFYSDLTLASGGTYSGFSPTFAVTASFTSLGKTLGGFGIDGAGITVTLGDALTVVTSGVSTLTNGALDLNGFTLSTGQFSSSNNNTRSIAFGTSNIALTSTTAATTVLSMATANNFTYTGTGGFSRNMAATATVVFGTSGGSVTNAPNLTVSAGASALTITASSWFNDIDFTGSTSTVSNAVNIAGDLTLASGGTYTAVVPTYRASGTLTSNGKTLSALTVNGSGITVTCADALRTINALTFTLGTLRLKDEVTSTIGSLVTTGTTLKYLRSTTTDVRATLSDPSGTNTVTYLYVQDIAATGGALFNATSTTNVDGGNNTGWLGFGSPASFLLFF